MADHRTFRRTGPALAEHGYRVLAVDLRGHGASPGQSVPPTPWRHMPTTSPRICPRGPNWHSVTPSAASRSPGPSRGCAPPAPYTSTRRGGPPTRGRSTARTLANSGTPPPGR
ncbi:hypothetical protein [Streptomyces axinellae]|uniref:hypothetical protein n=1 Tax=Streptomyces axinellae TaxID=552788 RepID=UPI003CD0582C